MAVPADSADGAEIKRIISMIDLTDLNDSHGEDGIARLLDDAARHQTAAVCVWPEFVGRCSRRLVDTGVRVATVANFPTGTEPIVDVIRQIGVSLDSGADEIDVVLPWRSFLAGDVDHARVVVSAAADRVHDRPGAHLKVILETGEMSASSITEASRLAIECGADFLKTSTGKTGTGATHVAVGAMLDVIVEHGGVVGIKPSGGIRTVADASGLLRLASDRLGPAWATPRSCRFGASGLLADALGAFDRM